MNTYYKLLISLGLTLACTSSMASNYYLCGTDEDGCNINNPGTCVCMPVDPPPAANGSYCLDLNDVSCKPYKPGMSCTKVFSPQALPTPQAACLSVAFTSEPSIDACKKVAQSTCQKYHIATCAKDGGQATCKVKHN